MSDIWKLPEGVKLPNKYRKTKYNQMRFIEGAQDGAAGREMTDEELLTRRQGKSAWIAYKEGYEAGNLSKLNKENC